MIRPRRAWPLYERFLRSVAGLGRVPAAAEAAALRRRAPPRRRPRDRRRRRRPPCGRRGGRRGESVVLVDEHGGLEGDGYELLAPARAIGDLRGWARAGRRGDAALPRSGRADRRRRRARSSSRSSSPGNDLVGVMLPGGRPAADRRLGAEAGDAGGRRGRRRRGPCRSPTHLHAAGTEVVRVVDLRRRAAVGARARPAGAGGSRPVTVRRRDDRLRPASSSRAGASRRTRCSRRPARASSTTPRRGIFVPRDVPAGVEAVVGRRRATAGRGPGRRATAAASDKCFVCVCEDVTTKDVRRARRGGLRLDRAREAVHDRDDGPVPGQAVPRSRRSGCWRGRPGSDESAIGTTTARPPWAAGRARPARRAPPRADEALAAPPPPRGARCQDDVDGRLERPHSLRRRRGARCGPCTRRSA